MATITSTNSIYTIIVPQLSILHQLQGYAANDAFDTETLEITENRVGVDGLKSAGYLPRIYNQAISLQADSQSILIFEIIYSVMQQSREIVTMEGEIVLPSVNKKYIMTFGTMLNYTPVAPVKNVLEPQQFSINWGTIVIQPL